MTCAGGAVLPPRQLPARDGHLHARLPGPQEQLKRAGRGAHVRLPALGGAFHKSNAGTPI